MIVNLSDAAALAETALRFYFDPWEEVATNGMSPGARYKSAPCWILVQQATDQPT